MDTDGRCPSRPPSPRQLHPPTYSATGRSVKDLSIGDRLSETSSPLLSVRGEARRFVTPDSAVLTGTMWGNQPSKAEVLAEVSVRWEALIADLGAAGGVPLGIETDRAPLTWSAQSTTTHPQNDRDPQTGRIEPSGRIIAAVHAVVTVRSFDRLEEVDSILTRHEGFSVHGVTWMVDADNPAWSQLRARGSRGGHYQGPRLRRCARRVVAAYRAPRRRWPTQRAR